MTDQQIESRFGYMCRVDFLHELESASGGIYVYKNINDVKKHRKCTNECGIVKVKITEIKEGDLHEKK